MDHGTIPHLGDALIFLGAAGVLVPLLQRLGVPPTLGYLLAGIALGPWGLGALSPLFPWLDNVTITDAEGVRQVGEIGVVLLLFTIGVELSVERIAALRRRVLLLGVLQLSCTAAVAGAVAAALFDVVAPLAALLGVAFALSSTALVVQFLTERRLLSAPAGRAAFGVLLFQDLAIVPVMFVLAAVGTGQSIPAAIAFGVLKAAAAVAVIVALGRLVLRPLLRLGGTGRGPEAFLATTMLIALATAAVTGYAGLSMALGAFLAGLLLAESEYRHAVEAGLAPIRGIFLGLFFAAVGLQLDFGLIWERAPLVLGVVVALYLVKGALVFALARALGMPAAVAVEAAFLLGQVGEFAFVLIGTAASLGPNAAALRDPVFAIVGVSLVAAPLVAALGRRAALALERREATSGERIPALDDHVVIIGFGRVGRLLDRMLDDEGVQHVMFDADPARAAAARKEGRPVWYGDGQDATLLRGARLGEAQALVIAIDEAEAAETIVALARREWPELTIIARSRDAAHARRLVERGATEAVPENLEASLRLAERLLISLGAPEETTERRLEAMRAESRAMVRPEG